jgi:sugar lactone lactonase YvrE
MARGPCGSLFVADSGNNRIVKWSPQDVCVACYPSPSEPRLARPQGIAVDDAGRIWVAETLGHRLQVFDALFRPLGAFGKPGEGLGQFREPQDLEIAPDRSVLIADTGNHRVQAVAASGAPLQALGRIENCPSGPPTLNAPSGIALHGNTTAYVADTGNHRVLRLERR